MEQKYKIHLEHARKILSIMSRNLSVAKPTNKLLAKFARKLKPLNSFCSNSGANERIFTKKHFTSS